MKAISTLLTLFLAYSLSSQPGQFFFGAGSNDAIQQITPSPDGNLFLLGSKGGVSNKIWLLKIDTAGNVIWEKTYNPSTPLEDEYGLGLTLLDDGSMLIIGQQLKNDGNGVALALKVNEDGTQAWKKTYENTDALMDAVPKGDGFLLVGWYDNAGATDSGVLIEINSSGGLLSRLPIQVANRTYVKRIFATNDGSFAMMGRSSVIGVGFEGIFITKFGGNNEDTWHTTYDTQSQEENFSPFGANFYNESMGAVQMDDGSFWVTNSYQYNSDIALLHFASDGDLVEEKFYGNPNIYEYPYSLTQTADGGWLIAGQAKVYDGIEERFNGFAMKLDATGLEQWRKYYGEEDNTERLFGCATPLGGNHFLVGTSNKPHGNGNTDFDGWLLKVEEDGNQYPWRVDGRVLIDLDDDCMFDFGEHVASGWFVKASANGYSKTMVTDREGRFSYRSDDATTTFMILSPDSAVWEFCNNHQTIISNSDNPFMELAFIAKQPDPLCAPITVSLTQPDLVRCKRSSFNVTVTNHSTEATDNLSLSVKIDPALFAVSASEIYSQTNSVLSFDIGILPRLSSKTIAVKVQLDCNAQLGATHPIIASIESMVCPSTWDGAFFSVDGFCDGDEIRFNLQNTGGASASTMYRVIADHVLSTNWTEVNLPEGAAPYSFSLPADGRTWRVELKQAEGFPVSSYPSTTIEGCGQLDNWLHTIGYLNAWRHHEGSPSTAYITPTNTTGVPNKITETPHGLGLYNLIHDLRPIEFTARVSNPLSVPGQKAEFQLSFSKNLDLSTFRVMASNAPVELFLTEDNGIRAIMKGVTLDTGATSGASAMMRFTIQPYPTTPPDSQGMSLLLVEGKAYINDFGPIELSPGFLNYTQQPLSESDEFYYYEPEIQTFSGRNYAFAHAMAQAEDGAVFLCGETNSYSDRTSFDGLVIKTNQYGRAFWLNAVDFDNGSSNSFTGVAPTTDGGCIAVGNYRKLGYINYLRNNKIHVCRFDNKGRIIWIKEYSPAGTETGTWTNGIIKTADGNFVVFGYAGNENAAGARQFYLKINQEGDIIWLKHQDIEGPIFPPSNAVAYPDGSIVFGGLFYDFSYTSIHFQKIDSDGNSKWSKVFNGSEEPNSIDICATPEGGVMFVGYIGWISTPNNYVVTPFFMKLDENGNKLWEKKYTVGPFESAYPYSICPAPGGGFLVGGDIFADTTNHLSDMMLMKIDEDANMLWWQHYGNKNSETVRDMLVSDSNQVLLWGYNQSRPPTWDLQALLARTDLEGTLYVDVPKSPMMHRGETVISPNPAHHLANVILSPQPINSVQWALFDVNGKPVSIGESQTGIFDIGTGSLPQGIYLLAFPEGQYPPKRILVLH
jgi:hypothetical protein